METYYQIALLVHLLGVVFGLGGATVSDVLFLKSLKDERITKKEKSFLDGASMVIWFGIALLLVSGSYMFWLNWDVLSGQARMQAHVSIGLIIILNGLFLNIYISPKLTQYSADKNKKFASAMVQIAYRNVRRLAFMSGAVSLTSWYSAFLLGFAGRFVLPVYSYGEIFGVYLLILVVVLLISRMVESCSWKKHMSSL